MCDYEHNDYIVTQEQVDALVAKLQPVGKQIADDADKGDRTAKEIMTYYSWFYKTKDHVSFAFLEAALDEWLEKPRPQKEPEYNI